MALCLKGHQASGLGRKSLVQPAQCIIVRPYFGAEFKECVLRPG